MNPGASAQLEMHHAFHGKSVICAKAAEAIFGTATAWPFDPEKRFGTNEPCRSLKPWFAAIDRGSCARLIRACGFPKLREPKILLARASALKPTRPEDGSAEHRPRDGRM